MLSNEGTDPCQKVGNWACCLPGSQTPIMSAQASLCFYQSVNAYKDGRISFEEHIRNAFSHVFARTRHRPCDDEVDEERVIYWTGRDALIAAVHVCLLQRDSKLSLREDTDAEETLVKMLLSIKAATLAGLRAMNQSASVLAVPLLYQLLVYVALEHGNLNLVREMIFDAPPGPGFHLLFSPPKEPSGPTLRKFGETRAIGPAVLDGQTSNGCELYTDLIKAGWAQPRGYMQQWAASSSDIKVGIQLLNVLVERGVRIDEPALYTAVMVGEVAMLEYLLPIYTPEEPSKHHMLLKLAAGRKLNGVKRLEVCFKHRMDDINWMPSPPTSHIDVRGHQEMRPLCETPLHMAAESGDPAAVEWLIRHGARRLKNSYDQDQVQRANMYEREDNLLVFQKYSGWELKEVKKPSCCSVM
ncbi:hypothetical protein B0O99DRAFT_189079 [Bisporella sp. PMI_857]|nr:hypothetical protein B0O99DRAFT_189079 [Bisporella sp. PMI_857]